MIILMFILLFAAVVFAVQNSQVVSVSFLSWSFTTVQALVILVSLFIGLIVGWVWSWLKGARTRGQVRQLTKALDDAKQALTAREATEAKRGEHKPAGESQ